MVTQSQPDGAPDSGATDPLLERVAQIVAQSKQDHENLPPLQNLLYLLKKCIRHLEKHDIESTCQDRINSLKDSHPNYPKYMRIADKVCNKESTVNSQVREALQEALKELRKKLRKHGIYDLKSIEAELKKLFNKLDSRQYTGEKTREKFLRKFEKEHPHYKKALDFSLLLANVNVPVIADLYSDILRELSRLKGQIKDNRRPRNGGGKKKQTVLAARYPSTMRSYDGHNDAEHVHTNLPDD